MKRHNEDNINTREYWNNLYKDREAYVQVTGNLIRFTKTLDYIKNGDKVLDIGCGIGLFTEMVKEKYPDCEVWGVDIADETIKENQSRNSKINYLPGVVGGLQTLPQGYFDVVFSGETLEHLDEPKTLFEDGYTLLRPGGKLIITTPKEDAIQTPEHTWFFTQEDVENLFINAGFKNISFTYLPDSLHLMIIYAGGTK